MITTATIIKLPRSSRLECSTCGATAEAACDCGAPYIPAGARAAKAIAGSPEKSDRAIAAEIGVSDTTVLRARKKATASHEAVEKRTGRDGKVRKLPQPKKSAPHASDPIHETCADCDTQEQHWQRSLSNLAGDAISMRAYWTREFGKWEKFETPSQLVKLAGEAARAWAKLASDLAKGR